MTDLNSLVVFAHVVEANSFSTAARVLRMPVSTVSRRVAELEEQLGVRLLERSTRGLRLTEIGADVFEQAQRSASVARAIEDVVSYRRTNVSGQLRLSAPPNISDSLLAPLISAFQASYPEVRIHVLVTERYVDHIADGVDLAFRIGALKDSSLVAVKLLSYRDRIVATPAYLKSHAPPTHPLELHQHRLLSFTRSKSENNWSFTHRLTGARETIAFQPALSMNDFSGLAAAVLSSSGIGELPPVVQPELVRSGLLQEVMTDWQLTPQDLSAVHLGNRHMSRPLRIFKDFAAERVPALFPDLHTASAAT